MVRRSYLRDRYQGALTIIMTMPFDMGSLLKKVSYGPRIRPTRDWLAILSVAGTLVVASIGWNLWLLRSVGQGGVIGNQSPPAAFDETPIESVRAVFESRAEEEARYADEYRFVDPSR